MASEAKPIPDLRRCPCPLIALGAACLVLAGCGGGGGSSAPALGPEIPLTGQASYERRILDPTRGLRLAPTLLPLADMDVEIVDEPTRAVLTRVRTDAEGRFEAGVRSGRRFRVVCAAEDAVDGLTVRVMDDETSRAIWAVSSDVLEAREGEPIDVDLRASMLAPDGAAGAFHILTALRKAAEAVRAVRGAPLPPLSLPVYWRFGNNGAIGTTFYDPDEDALWILGGVEAHDFDTDTDHFDDPVLVHEFGHYLARHFSRDDSRGGLHNGANLNPFLAYSEGLANFLSSLLRDDPLYVDSFGYGPWGGILIAFDLEDFDPGQQLTRGIGSEESISMALWDLVDAPAADDDPLALAPEAVWTVLADYVRVQPFVYVGDVFDGCEALGFASAADLATLLAPEEIVYPPGPDDRWPWPLVPPARAEGRIDALSSWPPNVVNGFDSAHFYEVTLDAPGYLVATLTIHGSGTTPEDLDLFLYSGTLPRLSRASQLQKSDHEDMPTEKVESQLPAGSYLIEVRGFLIIDGREIGQRADYALDVEVR